MTRRTLLSLPFVAPIAKALGASKWIEFQNGSKIAMGSRGIMPEVWGGMAITIDPRCPKNSIEIVRPEAWEYFIAPGSFDNSNFP